MEMSRYTWIFGLLATALLLAVPILIFVPDPQPQTRDPWAAVAPTPVHTDHSELMPGPYDSGPAVTRACLDCHTEAGEQMLQNAHWRWESDPVYLADRDMEVATGKKNVINNFCIGIQGNWASCTSCHAGYGWDDADYDFSVQENIDCLVCHDNSGLYAKSKAGLPAAEADLEVAAQSVGAATRESCGGCHFLGGGGNAVKHGDLDESLYFPSERVDVHMGKYDFQCTSCHVTEDHEMKGRSISVSVDDANQVYCTDCHGEDLHQDDRITDHIDTVACQTCHIPTIAKDEATKVHWDWASAGQDLAEDPHSYLKIKGSFIYEADLEPEYGWYKGLTDRYLLGDEINPAEVVSLNKPLGDVNDPEAKIWPFKIHRANQIYDTEYNYLLQPVTAGEDGYWTNFDWDQAARLGAEVTGLPYSGRYGFANTEMFWPSSHMVSPSEDALQCVDCHSDDGGRLDWQALGYDGDPVKYGGRTLNLALLRQSQEAAQR